MTVLKEFHALLKKQHDVDHNWWPTVSDNKRFEIMIGCILTQNTNWLNVEKAIENLYQENLIDEDRILKLNEKELAELIKPSGYYNQILF